MPDPQATDEQMSAQPEPPAGSAPQHPHHVHAPDEARQATDDAQGNAQGRGGAPHEDQGTGVDAGAAGHERQGRDQPQHPIGELRREPPEGSGTDQQAPARPLGSFEEAPGAPDWPPRGSAIRLPDGHRQHGSTGQLWEVQGGRWANRIIDAPAEEHALVMQATAERRSAQSEATQRVQEQIGATESPTEWPHDEHPLTMLQRLHAENEALKVKWATLELKLRHMI